MLRLSDQNLRDDEALLLGDQFYLPAFEHPRRLDLHCHLGARRAGDGVELVLPSVVLLEGVLEYVLERLG